MFRILLLSTSIAMLASCGTAPCLVDAHCAVYEVCQIPRGFAVGSCGVISILPASLDGGNVNPPPPTSVVDPTEGCETTADCPYGQECFGISTQTGKGQCSYVCSLPERGDAG